MGDPTSHEARIDALTDERDALKAGVNGLVQECDMLRTRITCVEAAYEKRIATLTAERDALNKIVNSQEAKVPETIREGLVKKGGVNEPPTTPRPPPPKGQCPPPVEGFHDGKRCPCEFEEIEPCGRMCSCRNPNMSGACRRCCTVGSPEQQLAKARWLVAREINFTILTREEAIDRIGKLDDPKLRPLIKWIAESLAFGRVAYDVRVNIAEAERSVERIVEGQNPGIPAGGLADHTPDVKKWPPLDPGTKVKTTKPFWSGRGDWTGEALASRKWGVKGTILKHHDSHGLCYEVQHDDGTVGHYDPSELEVLDIYLDVRPECYRSRTSRIREKK